MQFLSFIILETAHAVRIKICFLKITPAGIYKNKLAYHIIFQQKI